jgi:hypothetical protein
MSEVMLNINIKICISEAGVGFEWRGKSLLPTIPARVHTYYTHPNSS